MLKSELVWILDNRKSFGLKLFGFRTFFSVWKPNYGIEPNNFYSVLYIRDQTERSKKPNSPNVWNPNVWKPNTKKFGFQHCLDFGRSDFSIFNYSTLRDSLNWFKLVLATYQVGKQRFKCQILNGFNQYFPTRVSASLVLLPNTHTQVNIFHPQFPII